MGTVSSDLSALLNRVRKTNGLRQKETSTVEPPETGPPAEPQAQGTVTTVEESLKIDLQELHAELHADELLLERILGMLYRAKKQNPNGGAVSILEMERELGLEREAGAFIMAYMKTKKVIVMDDKSRMSITVEGIDYLRAVMIRGEAGH